MLTQIYLKHVFKYIYIYIYKYIHTSVFEISALMQAINFFQFNALKIFNAINAGVDLGLTHKC